MLEPEPFKESLGHSVTIPRASEGYTTERPAFEEIARLRRTFKAPPAHRRPYDARRRRSLSQHRLVDLDQEPARDVRCHALGQQTREPEMSERSEPKQVSRRGALAFFGYAAVFGLVATPAILTASQAEAQTTTAPATPTTPPTDAPKSGTERRQERRSGRAERRQERRTGRAERRQERRTGREERRDARDGTSTSTTTTEQKK